MKKFPFAILTVCLPLCAAGAALPSAQAVIDHWIAATGGRAAWEARHNLVEHATVEFAKQGIKGTLTVYQAAPDKYLGLTELPGIGKISTGSNGEVAWENTSLQGPRIKQGAEKADAFREGAFNADLNWQKLYAKGEIAGVEAIEGHECYKIVLTPKEGNPVTEYYDKNSGLLIKTTTTVTSQLGEIQAEILYSDYEKDGSGVLSAHRLVNRAAQQEFVIQIQSIETNVDLPKDRFDLPPEVQALVKKSACRCQRLSGESSLYIWQAIPWRTKVTASRDRAGGIDIDGSGSASLGPMKIDIEKFEVRTDAKFEPLEAIAKGKLGTIQMNVHTTFSGGQARNEIDTGQGPQSKDIPVHAGAVVVNANLPLYPWTLLAMRASFDSHAPQHVPVYVLGQAEEQATVVFKGQEPVEFASKVADLNHLSVSGTTPQGQAINLDLWVDGDRKIIKMAVPSQGVEAYQDGFRTESPRRCVRTAAPERIIAKHGRSRSSAMSSSQTPSEPR